MYFGWPTGRLGGIHSCWAFQSHRLLFLLLVGPHLTRHNHFGDDRLGLFHKGWDAALLWHDSCSMFETALSIATAAEDKIVEALAVMEKNIAQPEGWVGGLLVDQPHAEVMV